MAHVSRVISMGTTEKVLLAAVGLGVLYLLTRPQPQVGVSLAQSQQMTPSKQITYPYPIPVPTPTPEIPIEEPMEYGIPEENGGGFGEAYPAVESQSDCFMQCLMAGYLNGNCYWPSEAPDGSTQITWCFIPGSRHCGILGQCGCYCWGSYDG